MPTESNGRSSSSSSANGADADRLGLGRTAARERIGSIRRVLVAAHSAKDAAGELFDELVPWLVERGVWVHGEHDLFNYAAERERAIVRGEEHEELDLAIVLGGDGAILTAVRAFRDDPVPILGINFGRVGFLAATPGSRWEQTLQSVLDGRALLEPRMRLLMRYRTVSGELRAVALNDVVVSRRPEESMLQIALDVG
ncbi:MAG: NAD(+)/NADH kinase, partial [Planctomycetota bacterium]